MQHRFLPSRRSALGRSAIAAATVLLSAVACQDASAPLAPGSATPYLNQSDGRGIAKRLYAIGTSISAGTCSDGNVYWCQQNSWVAQIIRAMHEEPDLPLIAAPGCKAPFASPLGSFVRISGESVVTSDEVVRCESNVTGVTLPTQVLAIPGAWTHEALHQTPANRFDPFGARLYRRILPLDKTQVTALESVKPKFVTVELGVNDILQVGSGIVIPGATYAPFATWSPVYNQILDRVEAVTKQVLLVGLGSDISKMHSLRRGYEFWADRAAFLAVFNVQVSADCDGSQNLLTVPYVVPAAVATGVTMRQLGLGPYSLSCAGGSATTRDYILNTSEQAAANAVFVQMTNHIRQQAQTRGWAYFDLDVLLNTPKPAFSVVTLMTTAAPYGLYFSLDGFHPTTAGHTLLALAALQAIDQTYHFGFDEVVSALRR